MAAPVGDHVGQGELKPRDRLGAYSLGIRVEAPRSGTELLFASADRIDERARPLDDIYGYDETGAGVNVYVLDSGVRVGHGDFGGRARRTRLRQRGRRRRRLHGHGTHVTGTIAGAESGMAKGASVITVRVLGCVDSTYTDVIQGVDWVTANHVKPAVANYGTGSGSPNLLAYRVTGPVVNPLERSSTLSRITCGTAVGGADSLTLTWKRTGSRCRPGRT